MNDLMFLCQAVVINGCLDKNTAYNEFISYMKTIRTKFSLDCISAEQLKSMDPLVWRLNEKEKSLVEQARDFFRRGSSIFMKNTKFKGLINLGNSKF
jgi:hypothetical protein